MAGKSDIPAGGHFIEKFARHALAPSPRDFPDAAVRQAELLLLDTIAAGIGARGEASAQGVLDCVREMGGAPQCTVIGEARKTGAPQAVLANGMLMRALDMNDYVPALPSGEFGGHPSDNICVALAAAELSGASGRDALAAIIIGYEIYGRAYALMQRGGAWDNVTVSGFAAPVIAGRLLRLDAAQLANALSLSLSRAATSAMVRVADVSSAKSLANPLVAQNAMQACILAKHGATGPMPLFEHERAMQSVFPHLEALEELLAPFTPPQVDMAASIKDYPCLATGQTVAAAGLACHRQFGGQADHIEAVEIAMADTRQIREHLVDASRNDPRTREAADHSYQFIFAAAYLDGAFGLEQFEKQLWNAPAARALIAKISLVCDPQINALAPGGFPCRARIRTRTGSTHVAEIAYPPGFSRGRLDEAAILEKFQRLATPHLPAPQRDRIAATCLRARELPSISALMRLLGGRGA